MNAFYLCKLSFFLIFGVRLIILYGCRIRLHCVEDKHITRKFFLSPAKVFRLAYVVANNTSVKSELKQSILFFIIPNEPSQAQVEDVLDYSI